MADNTTSTPKQKVQFWRGKELKNPADGNGEIVFINNTMGETGPADVKDQDSWDIDKKLGSIYQDDKIVGTTKADDLCLTKDIKVTRDGVAVGGIIKDEILEKGMSLTEILEKMFCLTYYPSYNDTIEYTSSYNVLTLSSFTSGDADTVYRNILVNTSNYTIEKPTLSDYESAANNRIKTVTIPKSSDLDGGECKFSGDNCATVNLECEYTESTTQTTDIGVNTTKYYYAGSSKPSSDEITDTTNTTWADQTSTTEFSGNNPTSATYYWGYRHSYEVTGKDKLNNPSMTYPYYNDVFKTLDSLLSDKVIKDSDGKPITDKTKIGNYTAYPTEKVNTKSCTLTANKPDDIYKIVPVKIQSVLPVFLGKTDNISNATEKGTTNVTGTSIKGITGTSVSYTFTITSDEPWSNGKPLPNLFHVFIYNPKGNEKGPHQIDSISLTNSEGAANTGNATAKYEKTVTKTYEHVNGDKTIYFDVFSITATPGVNVGQDKTVTFTINLK